MFDTQVVINNAAVPQYGTLQRTAEGFEAQLGANHLGHFLFTSLIFPAVLKAACANKDDDPARIVFVSSAAANFPGAVIRWDDPNFELRSEEYGKYEAYAQSKLASILFAKELAKKYKTENVIAFSLHPGGESIQRRNVTCMLTICLSDLSIQVFVIPTWEALCLLRS